jgi:bifunctional DNase/RNase
VYRTIPSARTGIAVPKALARGSRRPVAGVIAPRRIFARGTCASGDTLGVTQMREMTVYGVSFDLVGKQPIVLLKTQDGNTFLPIWIGHPEAAAILMNLQGTEPPRPMTHDLATSIIASLDAEIRQVTVTELRDSTFYALITLVRNGTEIELDARTSDAIALALRSDAKIYAADDVIEESGVEFEGDEEEASRRFTGQVQPLSDLDPDEFRRFLDTVSPDEFAAEPEDE